MHDEAMLRGGKLEREYLGGSGMQRASCMCVHCLANFIHQFVCASVVLYSPSHTHVGENIEM